MIILSTGMGINSTAMLIGMKDRCIIPDIIIFSDTGAEKPHTYKYIQVLNEWLSSVGFPEIVIVRVESETLEESCIKNKCLPSVAYGGFKTCSQRFKIAPIDKYLNSNEQVKAVWDQGEKVIKYIGYDLDEPGRAKNYDSNKYKNEYPLIEWGWGRDECIEVIKKEGLPVPGKSSCYFCPNMHQSEIRELNKQYPELALRAIELEDNADLTSIKGLGRDWRWKDLLDQGEMFDFPETYRDIRSGCYDGDG